jgi:hypothetical protein
MVALVSALMINSVWAREPAIAQDVAGIKLGDTRAVEATVSPRAKPWLRVFYENNQVVGVIYRQPGLSNERTNQLAFVNRICEKYGENNFCVLARRGIEKSAEPADGMTNTWTGFSSLYTVDGGFLTARVRREDTFSFFPKLMVEIEMWKDGYELPK